MIMTAKCKDFTMDCCRFGSGKRPFVFIPGLTTARITALEAAYSAILAPLTGEFTVYMFDRRTELPDTYSTEEMAEDTAAAMKELGLEDVCLYGASQGGMICQLIAERHPELVKKLILVSSSSRPNDLGTEVIGKWLDIARKGDGAELNRDMIYKAYSPKFIKDNYDLMQSCMVPMSGDALKRFITLAQPVITFDHYADLADIRCETLVICSGGDQVFTAQPSEDMAEKLGCSIYVFGDECSHAVYDESPECTARILEFVTEQ